MADWTGVGRNTAEVYREMAEHELHGVSPSYEALRQAVAGSETVCTLLDRLPRGKRQPNLLLAAVRFLDSPVRDPATFVDFVTAQWDVVADTMMTHRTQTNEPGRCATLLPLLASLPQPLALGRGRSERRPVPVAAYLDQEQRNQFTDVMHALKGARGVHWVSNEAPGVISGADLDPRPRGRFILAHDQVPVAVTGPHGQSLDSLPSPG